jgi:hypothetical protein
VGDLIGRQQRNNRYGHLYQEAKALVQGREGRSEQPMISSTVGVD